jgi:hypothetical protein
MKGNNMSKVIINYTDGTVTDLEDSVIVDLDKLDAEGNNLWQEWLEGGNDATASDLGRIYGTNINNLLKGEDQ